MRILGLILIVLGIIGLLYGGIRYTQHKKVLDVGALEVHADEKKTVPISPVAGGVAVLAGVLLVATNRRRA